MKKLNTHVKKASPRSYREIHMQRESLQVLKDIRAQNEKLLEQGERAVNLKIKSNLLGKNAERAFFAVATPYYSSQFFLHFMSDEFWQVHPQEHLCVMITAAALGASFAYPEGLGQAKIAAGEITKKVKRIKNVSNDAILDTSIAIYFGFQKASTSLVPRKHKKPQRAVSNQNKNDSLTPR